MIHKHCLTWNMVKNTENTSKIRNAHCTAWNMEKKKKKNVENEKFTLYDLEYRKNTMKMWKIRNIHFRTWNITRNTGKHGK